MTTQTVVLTADVPDDQAVSAEAAAAAFVSDFPTNVPGAIVLAASYGGTSLLPDARQLLDAALDTLRGLSDKSPKATPAEVAAAADAVDQAVKVYEATLTLDAAPAAPTPVGVPADQLATAPTVDPDTAAAVAPAPTGEEPALPPYVLPGVPPAPVPTS